MIKLLNGVLPSNKKCDYEKIDNCDRDGLTVSTKTGRWVCLHHFREENPVSRGILSDLKKNTKLEQKNNSSIDIPDDYEYKQGEL